MPQIPGHTEGYRGSAVSQRTRPPQTREQRAGWANRNAPLWRRERNQRHADRRDRAARGLSTPKVHQIALVELDLITVPDWARQKAIKGLSITETSIWLRRIAANKLASLDIEAGGCPRLTPTAYRRCKQCGRPLLGVDAEGRLDLDRKFEGDRIPCGPECLEIINQRRETPRRAKGAGQ